MNEIVKCKNEIEELCKKHRVHGFYVFGSVLTESFNADSDIDFLINFQDIELLDYADNYFGLLFALQELFDRNVDLLTEQSLKNPYFIEEINRTKQLIYAA